MPAWCREHFPGNWSAYGGYWETSVEIPVERVWYTPVGEATPLRSSKQSASFPERHTRMEKERIAIRISRDTGGSWQRNSKDRNPIRDCVYLWCWGYHREDFPARIRALEDWLREQEREAESQPEPISLHLLMRDTFLGNGQTQFSGSVGKMYQILREAEPQFADQYSVTNFREYLDHYCEQCDRDGDFKCWVSEDKFWVKKTGWNSKNIYTVSQSPVPAKADKLKRFQEIVESHDEGKLTIDNQEQIAKAFGCKVRSVWNWWKKLNTTPSATVPATRAKASSLAERVRATAKIV